MGEDRDEAMRQQDATEAMIRMRDRDTSWRNDRQPVRPSESGRFMPCPAKGLVTLNCEMIYEQSERQRITGRIWTLILCDKDSPSRQIEYVRVENAGGEQVGEVASAYTTSAFALSAANCKLLSMFLNGDWEDINVHLLASVS